MQQGSNSSGNSTQDDDSALLSCLTVLNHVAVGIYAVDREGLCATINPAALQLLGYSEAECIGADLHALMHSRHADGSPYPVDECPLYLARLTGKPVHDLEETLWKRSGEPVRVLCSSVPLKRGDDVYGTVITLNDMTSHLAVEEQLRQTEQQQQKALHELDAAAKAEREEADRQHKASVQVERFAAEELREQQKLAEEQLMQSEKLAAVGRLMASISHEINNPLEAVTNLLYLARQDENICPESDGYLHQAEQELRRVSEIVSQTLRFQRGGANFVDCVPDSLIESVVALHQGRLHNSGIRIERQHRRSFPFRCVEGDIRQILNNLVGNAIDAIQQGGGVITIRTAPATDPRSGHGGVRISVSDSGHGMDGRTAAQIFEPFYTTKGSGGSGLGLWISNSIAKRHGGRLSVRSRMGDKKHGTTFSLFVPGISASA
ncbi:MAG: two-component system sensor histidine kinase NtrB [Janthinobacterium lividum]